MNQWQQTINRLKELYPDLHYHYSGRFGWRVLSWKDRKIKIFEHHNKEEINTLIRKLYL